MKTLDRHEDPFYCGSQFSRRGQPLNLPQFPLTMRRKQLESKLANVVVPAAEKKITIR